MPNTPDNSRDDLQTRLFKDYAHTLTKAALHAPSTKALKKKYQAWQAYYGRFLPSEKAAAIIDIGCGHGDFCLWLQKLGYSQASGIDLNAEHIEFGKKMGVRNIEQGDVFTHLGTSAARYDFVVLRDVLEHFDHEGVIQLLVAVRQALKPNGQVLIQVPNGQSPFFGDIFYGDFTHRTAFTVSSLGQVLHLCGMRLLRVRPIEPIIRGPLSFFRFLVWSAVKAALHIATTAETGGGKRYFSRNIVVSGTPC